MGRVKQTEIVESTEELLKLMRTQKSSLAQSRLRAFYLYKTGKANQYEQIAKEVGYERHAVGQWFKCYQEKGLAACIEIDAGGNRRTPAIRGSVLEALKAKLSDSVNYFTSYKQIHEWLEKEHGLRLKYEYVHKFVHGNLGAKLKVVRKSNLKKDAALEDKFKKS